MPFGVAGANRSDRLLREVFEKSSRCMPALDKPKGSGYLRAGGERELMAIMLSSIMGFIELIDRTYQTIAGGIRQGAILRWNRGCDKRLILNEQVVNRHTASQADENQTDVE